MTRDEELAAVSTMMALAKLKHWYNHAIGFAMLSIVGMMYVFGSDINSTGPILSMILFTAWAFKKGNDCRYSKGLKFIMTDMFTKVNDGEHIDQVIEAYPPGIQEKVNSFLEMVGKK